MPHRDRVAVTVPFPGWLALRTFRWGMRKVTSLRLVTEGDTFVAVSWRRCQEGARLASRGSGCCVLLLATSGGGLVAVVVMVFPHDASKGSSSRELSVGWVAEAAVAPCVVSSSESECGELLYLSELRVFLCKFSGSSDLWVETQTSGSLAGVREVRRATSLQGSCACYRRVAAVAMLRAWRVWSLGRFVPWWRGWRWTRWQCSSPYGGQLQASPDAVLLVVFISFGRVCVAMAKRAYICLMSVHCSLRHLSMVVVGLVLAGCELWLRCIAWLPYVLGLRYAVVLVGVFLRVLPELCLGGSGGGFAGDRVSFVVARHLWGCRSVWTPYVWLELKALAGDPFSLFLLPISFPLPSVVLHLPLSPLCVSGEKEGRACVLGIVELAWRWSIPWVCLSASVATMVRIATLEEASSRVAVAVPFPIPMGWLALRTFRWQTLQVTLLRLLTEGDTFMAMSLQRCQEDLLARACLSWPMALSRVRACLVVAGLVVGCLCCLGPPSSGAFEGAFGATRVLELANELADYGAEGKTRPVSPSSHCIALHWFWSHVGREAEAGARLASRGSGWCVLLFAASGSGLVVVVVMVFPQDFRSPVPWCQSVVAPVCVVSQPCGVSRVRGGSACGPLTLWRSKVAMLVAHLLPSARGSSSRELGVRRVAEAAVAPCVVSSSESEYCELLYLSELRVVLCKFSGYAP
ncbi:hypothetical protein Taro_004461 [Colocasia esculenta]|uniref:Uncharacterized protein n=1 Tax=Colocasia esculenta TaxID=4460 RepID=A0A843TPJ8_COLES|nr:hypothetical protein [Colocasia esculenta]